MTGKSEASDLAKMRLWLQSQQAPAFNFTPVSNVGQGISQAASNIMQMVVQHRNQQMLQDMVKQEQDAQQKAAAQKLESLRPLQGLTGQSPETMANLDSSTLNNLLTSGQNEAGIIKKAQALQEQFGQQPVTLDNPDFTNLSVDGYNLPGSTADMLARDPEAYQQIAKASANQQLRGAYHPDLSTADGRNAYQQTFGVAPTATSNTIPQENATLQGSLLGNQYQALINQYLPAEKKLALLNGGLDADKKKLDNHYIPLLNDASLASSAAGTKGQNISNGSNAIDLSLKNDAYAIMAGPLPLDKKIALVSTLNTDPEKIVRVLKEFNVKGGVAGIKAADLTATINRITQEAKPKTAPAPVPAKPLAPATPKASGQQLGTMARGIAQGIEQARTQPREVPFNAMIRGAGDLLHNTQGFIGGFGQGFSGQPAPAPSLPAQQPITLPGIQQARAQAQANVSGLTQNINAAQSLINSNNNATLGAQNTLNAFNAHEEARKRMAQNAGLKY